jgi:hypothetical protein
MVEYANLRDEDKFPPFGDLPHEDDLILDHEYYAAVDGFRLPQKHWCFLAEITDIISLGRVVLTVRDMRGQEELRVAFYTDDRGRDIPLSRLERRHTVAIMYANQHDFLDMSHGIRQEEMRTIKVGWHPVPALWVVVISKFGGTKSRVDLPCITECSSPTE